jgi:hypothetical protein
MPCEHYQNALVEAAATGAEPLGELRAHLAACAVCRAAFAQEQSLFYSIDTSLHVTANAEVPASLLPRVRTRLVEAAAPQRMWTPSWLALAGAAAMVVTFVAARAVWHTNIEQTPVRTATNASTPAPVVPPPQIQYLNALPSVSKNSVSQPRTAGTINLAPREALASRNTMPEVLVPRDQEVLLVSYAEQWSQRKHAPLVAANFDTTILSPLQVAPIQIDELGVKLLADEKSQ